MAKKKTNSKVLVCSKLKRSDDIKCRTTLLSLVLFIAFRQLHFLSFKCKYKHDTTPWSAARLRFYAVQFPLTLIFTF